MQEDLEETAFELTPATDALVHLLSAIIDSSHDAIISKTLEGVITSWNRSAEEMFGYRAAEAVGRSMTLIIPHDRLAEEDYVLDQIRRGEKVDHFETVRQTKDGRRLPVSITVSPIRDATGVIIGASNISRDISERKRLEPQREELLVLERTARQQLAEAVAARDEFIAVAAHELRNPLNVFVLNLQLLHRISGDPASFAEARGAIEKTSEQLGRIITLVDRLLDVTRVRAGTFELYRESFELGALVSEIAARFTNERIAAPISLEIQASVKVHWDRTRIDQALTNLISNAIKYGKNRPIRVTAHAAGDQAIISVRDQGIGMSPEDLERVFDRFERGAGRLGRDGLGLGLWITKQIAQAHGGIILADSELDQGSTFVMLLPLRE